jgi:trk system potassium uptake protein TrkA
MTKPGRGKFAVLGLGEFGSTVAKELQRMGNAVLGADRDEQQVNAVSDDLTQALIADVRDARALEEMGLKDFDAVIVAIGEDLESNILCTMSLKDAGVRQIWVKARGESHRHILKRLGVQRIINPEYEVGLHVANSLNYPFVLDYINVGRDMLVAEIGIPGSVAGRRIYDLDRRCVEALRFLALVRDLRPVSQDVLELELEGGDTLIVMGTLEAVQDFGRCL